MKARAAVIVSLIGALAAAACNEIAGIEEGILDTTTATGGAGGAGGATGTETTGTTTSTSPPCEDGTTTACYEGPTATRNVGQCQSGERTCSGGEWGPCLGQVVPGTQETCDGGEVDENCDGAVNEGCACAAGATASCYGGPDGTIGVGKCQSGIQSCEDGSWGPCDRQVLPQSEICDGADDDCDGLVDDVEGFGESCPTGLPGVCATGTKECVGGALGCIPSTGPSTEACDGLDNDCNDVVDDIPANGCALPLDAGGTCQGVTTCLSGTPSCSPSVLFFDSFGAGSAAWTLAGEWQIGALPGVAAVPGLGNPDPTNDHTLGSIDNAAAGVVLGGNASTTPHAATYLTSKTIDASAVETLHLSFERWLNNNPPALLHTVEVSMNNGQTWEVVWTDAAAAVNDAQWTLATFDITPYASATLQVRFGMAVLMAGSPTVSSWNLDDVVIGSCPAAD